jgi:hypothetical protein
VGGAKRNSSDGRRPGVWATYAMTPPPHHATSKAVRRQRGPRGGGGRGALEGAAARSSPAQPQHAAFLLSRLAPPPRLLEKTVDLNALFTLAAPIMHLMPGVALRRGARCGRPPWGPLVWAVPWG